MPPLDLILWIVLAVVALVGAVTAVVVVRRRNDLERQRRHELPAPRPEAPRPEPSEPGVTAPAPAEPAGPEEPEQAGTRVGIALSSTLVGMALGGWMAGAIFDATGSYQAAMWNGIAWNLLNFAIALWLLTRARRWSVRRRLAASPA